MNERRKMLVELTEDDLREIIMEVLVSQSKDKRVKIEIDPVDDLIPRMEVAKLFDISLVTLAKWARLKILPKAIKKGGRVFYLRSELNECIRPVNH